MSARTTTLLALASALLAGGCSLVAPTADIITGSCEGSAFDKDMSSDTANPEVDPEVWGEADGDDIVLHLENLDANCCPSAGADIVQDGFSIEVDFQDVTADEACGCMCVMDFEVRIADLGPGSYSVDVDYNGSDLAVVEVEVP
jgi:hypothetical protein